MANRRRNQRGNSLLEFSMCWLFLVPLLCGMVVASVVVNRYVQTMTVSRDAGHMFARWVDFSLSSNKQLVVRLAAGLDMTEAGGNGVVYLTQVMYVDDAQCQGGGLSNSQCPNWHKYVILKRVSIGNTSLRSSAYGTPNPALLNSDGSASAANYLRDNSLVVPTGAVLPGLAGGEFAYLSEAHFTMPNLSLPYFNVAGASYANSIY